jgi:Kef-type K+ transport system membrane component KefB
LLLSWLAVKIGIAAIIGAFFAGLVFADYSPQWNLIPRVAGITEFLAPFFFFTIGARINASLMTRDILISAMVISLLAVLSKLIGCGLPMIGQGWRQVLQVGTGMMPRGEVALIVALVGLQSGIVTQSTYAIVVLMTAVTTVLAPPILRVLFRREIEARQEEHMPATVQL